LSVRFAMMSQAFTSRLLFAVAIVATTLSLFGQGAQAQIIIPPESAAKPPVYQRFRYDEDYTYLRDPAKRTDFFDPIKYIPLNSDRGGGGDWYLSFGGEARERYEMYNNNRWNPKA